MPNRCLCCVISVLMTSCRLSRFQDLLKFLQRWGFFFAETPNRLPYVPLFPSSFFVALVAPLRYFFFFTRHGVRGRFPQVDPLSFLSPPTTHAFEIGLRPHTSRGFSPLSPPSKTCLEVCRPCVSLLAVFFEFPPPPPRGPQDLR